MPEIDDDEDDELPMVILCAGPPICELKDFAALEAMSAGCIWCRREIVHADGTIEVVQRGVIRA